MGSEVLKLLRGGNAPRLLLGLALLAPAALLGDRSGDPAVQTAVAQAPSSAGEAPELEHRRLDALFADHYDIPLDLAERIHEAARLENVDPVVAFGLVRTESSFRRSVVSYAGAVGYTQLLPSTARWMQPGLARRDLFNSETNLRVGFRYLRYLLDYYEGDLRLALTAYNRGPGTVDRLLDRGRNPENGYADRVLGTGVERRRGGRTS